MLTYIFILFHKDSLLTYFLQHFVLLFLHVRISCHLACTVACLEITEIIVLMFFDYVTLCVKVLTVQKEKTVAVLLTFFTLLRHDVN